MATNWKSRLNDAKEMLEANLISEEEYIAVKNQALQAISNPEVSYSPTPFIGNSQDLKTLSSYKILGLIGEGGMGVVYRGVHQNDEIAKNQGGEVAIKVMHPQYAKRKDLTDRFEQEARLGMKLKHNGIVNVHDFVMDGTQVAIVMEIVEGKPLSEVIGVQTGPIPWERAKDLFFLILEAVEYAHKQGVVHRDIKPENIMITSDQQIKILDFGIAKDMDSSKTKTGTGMGTTYYMAPEQFLDAKTVDKRADIYALGITLYEIVSGQLPWSDSDTEFAIMQKKAQGDLPPPTDFYPYIPLFVIDAISKATEVSKEDRFIDCHVFKKTLLEQLNVKKTSPMNPSLPQKQEDIIPKPKPSSSFTRMPLILAGGVLFILLAIGGLVFILNEEDTIVYSHEPIPEVKLVPAPPSENNFTKVIQTISLVYKGWEELDHNLYMSAWSRSAVWKSNTKEIDYEDFRKKRERDYKKYKSVQVEWNCDTPSISGENAKVYCTYSMYFTKWNNEVISERNKREYYRLQKEGSDWKIIENRDYLK